MGVLAIETQEIGDGRVVVDPDDLGAWRHHLAHAPVAELEHAVDHLRLSMLQFALLPAKAHHRLNFGFRDGCALTADGGRHERADVLEQDGDGLQDEADCLDRDGDDDGSALWRACADRLGNRLAEDQQDGGDGNGGNQHCGVLIVDERDGDGGCDGGGGGVDQVVAEQDWRQQPLGPLDEARYAPSARRPVLQHRLNPHALHRQQGRL